MRRGSYNDSVAIEIEAKIKVERLDAYAERLAELRAALKDQVSQRDVFYDRADGSLLKSDSGLRVREEVRQASSDTTLCFKGPRQAGPYKRRVEIELGVCDAEAAKRLVEALGYVQTVAVRKDRRIWRLGECDVCLDEVAGLGDFIEVEGPCEKAISEVLGLLQLEGAQCVKESYAVLLAGTGIDGGIDRSEGA